MSENNNLNSKFIISNKWNITDNISLLWAKHCAKYPVGASLYYVKALIIKWQDKHKQRETRLEKKSIAL